MIHDGAGEFRFDFLDYGIESLKASFRSPNLNSIAERFVGSVRREAPDHFLLFNKNQVFGIIKKYIELQYETTSSGNKWKSSKRL